MKRQFLLVFIICLPVFSFAQVVYQDLTRTSVYDFLDELANLKVIEIHSAVKPYSRELIAQKLHEAETKSDRLSKRQQKQLAFYLKDYNLELQKDLSYLKRKKGVFRKRNDLAIPYDPLSFQYKDSIFTFSLRPIYGLEGIINGNGSSYNRWGGAELFGYVTRHFGFYASLRDNHQEQVLVTPQYITPLEGGSWKMSGNSGDYSEMRGGITVAWNWGSVALLKDHFEWGDSYHGSTILSGRTPSFPYLELKMNPVKWFSFDYVAGWMVSEVIDSSRTFVVPEGTRKYYFHKFLAASMLTFTPWKRLDISVGNSVVFCAPYFNPAYLSPFLFFSNFHYKGDSLQTPYYGANSQLFLNISSRQIKHLHLYASIFLDQTEHNRMSWKAGFRVSDLLIHNVSLTAEYTLNQPTVYKYSEPTLTFASNDYGLGSYLLDNSQEVFAEVDYIPIRGLSVGVSYLFAERGEDAPYQEDNSVPLLKNLTWNEQGAGVSVRYEFLNNAYVFMDYMYRQIGGEVQYTPELFRGYTNTLTVGFNIGF